MKTWAMINLEKSKIKNKKFVFLGNMNNYPYEFAKELKKRGYNITFIVDAERNYLLDRPESLDKELNNNYPGWIIEKPIPWKMKALKFSFPNWYFIGMIRFLNSFDIIFLNGHWISLGGFVKKDKLVIDLFAGFDLDVAANFNKIPVLTSKYKQAGNIINKVIPTFLVNVIFRRMISFQRKGIRRADIVNYYPSGINPGSDELLSEIKEGQHFIKLEVRGFDCKKFPYKEPIEGKRVFSILNITRFFYLNNSNANKRNDIMIKGIGIFLKKNNIKPGDVEIIFFNKGEDVKDAKRLCEQYGLTPFITWKQEVAVDDLNNYFETCDVAFDQLGHHWVGAGLFSMLIGRPLIANGRPEIFEKITKEKSPICQATNEEEVEMWLTKLYLNRPLIKEMGKASSAYVRKHHSVERPVNLFLEFLETNN